MGEKLIYGKREDYEHAYNSDFPYTKGTPSLPLPEIAPITPNLFLIAYSYLMKINYILS